MKLSQDMNSEHLPKISEWWKPGCRFYYVNRLFLTISGTNCCFLIQIDFGADLAAFSCCDINSISKVFRWFKSTDMFTV